MYLDSAAVISIRRAEEHSNNIHHRFSDIFLKFGIRMLPVMGRIANLTRKKQQKVNILTQQNMERKLKRETETHNTSDGGRTGLTNTSS